MQRDCSLTGVNPKLESSHFGLGLIRLEPLFRDLAGVRILYTFIDSPIRIP